MKRERIIAIRRDNLGRLVEFKTNNNKIYNYEMAKEAIDKGLIINAEVITGKDSLMHIKKKDNKDSDFNNTSEF
ncbi:TPA: DUF3892 domain-containing protein [bacterium]|nr:DUF3892 domain-containing protein [bacterium]